MVNVNLMNAEIDVLTRLLARVSGIKRFSPLIEEEFQQNYHRNHFQAARLTLVFGLFLFTAGSVFIVAFFPNWLLPFSVSIFMVSPILILLLFLCYTKLFAKFQQLIILLFAITILVGLSVIAAEAPMPMKDLVYQGMILPSLFVTTLANLQFRYSIFIVLVVMIASNISYHFSELLVLHNYYSFFVNNYLLFGGSILCLIASYYYESYSRKEFLLGKIIFLKNRLLEYLSHYDALTNVANRRFFDETFDKEWRRALREGQSLGLIFIDFDYFKEYNDLYGHILGDKALSLVAQTLQVCARRPGDFIARYGGDEFLMLLANTSLEGAIQVGKNVQAAIKALHIPHADSKIADDITTTMGITAVKPTIDMLQNDLLKQADIALNNGKKTLRNNIYAVAFKHEK